MIIKNTVIALQLNSPQPTGKHTFHNSLAFALIPKPPKFEHRKQPLEGKTTEDRLKMPKSLLLICKLSHNLRTDNYVSPTPITHHRNIRGQSTIRPMDLQ